MKNAIELDIHGIKCDHCDYINKDVSVEEYGKWLNKPCPKCGENLLTEEDFNNTKLIMQLANTVNNIFPQRENDEDDVIMEVKMNGTGNMKFNIKD